MIQVQAVFRGIRKLRVRKVPMPLLLAVFVSHGDQFLVVTKVFTSEILLATIPPGQQETMQPSRRMHMCREVLQIVEV